MRLRSFVVVANDANVFGDESISYRGKVVGWVTCGKFAHHSGVSVAQGYVLEKLADNIDGCEIEIIGEQLGSRLQVDPFFDTNSERILSLRQAQLLICTDIAYI